MSAKEFILIPKNQYIAERPLAERVLIDPTIKAKATQLALLNRFEEDDKEVP